MAIGDVQNRYGVLNRTNPAADTERPQVRNAMPQGNPVPEQTNTALAPERAIQAQNIAPENTRTPALNQNPGAGGILNQNQVNNFQQAAVRQTQNANVEPRRETANIMRRMEENTLIGVRKENPAAAPAGKMQNKITAAVRQTANVQINRIENANANAANVSGQVLQAAATLTPENQVGARVDLYA